MCLIEYLTIIIKGWNTFWGFLKSFSIYYLSICMNNEGDVFS